MWILHDRDNYIIIIDSGFVANTNSRYNLFGIFYVTQPTTPVRVCAVTFNRPLEFEYFITYPLCLYTTLL